MVDEFEKLRVVTISGQVGIATKTANSQRDFSFLNSSHLSEFKTPEPQLKRAKVKKRKTIKIRIFFFEPNIRKNLVILQFMSTNL